MNKKSQNRNVWGRARAALFLHKDKIFNLYENGHTITHILEHLSDLNISYHSLRSFIKKYYVNNNISNVNDENKSPAAPAPAPGQNDANKIISTEYKPVSNPPQNNNFIKREYTRADIIGDDDEV